MSRLNSSFIKTSPTCSYYSHGMSCARNQKLKYATWHEIKTLHPSAGYWWVEYQKSEDYTEEEGGMWGHALPCCWKGINGRTQERAVFEQISSPRTLRTLRSTSVLIGSSQASSHETQLLWTCFWSQLLTPFIVSSSGSDNSIKGFTGLHVHRIHKAPHGSTTETS